MNLTQNRLSSAGKVLLWVEMTDAPGVLHKASILENEPIQGEVGEGNLVQSRAAAQHTAKKKASTLLATGLLMAVTMFSFEATKQTLIPHVSIWQSHCITICFSTITAVIVAYILLRLNQIRDMRLAHEISQRRLTEAARLESEEALQRHMELQNHVTKVTATVPGMIYSHLLRSDGSSSMPYASPGIESLFGLNPEAVRKSADVLLSMVHKDDIARVRESIAASAAGMTLWREEFRILHPRKGERWMEGHSVPHVEPGGSILWHGFMDDITERKRIDEQLLRSQRMESLGTLASGIAHDLNNILSPILMAAPILQNQLPPGERYLMTTIEKSAQRGADIVKQVLAFARGIEGERVSLQPRHLVKEVELMMRETFPKSIVIRNCTPNDLWPIIGDSTQIHQVLLNLCINARDAMPDGGRLTLSAENLSIKEGGAAMLGEVKSGEYVVLTVTDSGTGISPGVINKIFDPFFTTKETGKGTGLGLSTVLGIVKSHDGFVKVYSEPGEGSAFKVYLPANPADPADLQRKVEFEPSSGNGEWILIADDEPAVRMVTETVLRNNGYNVLAAADGAAALSLYAAHTDKIKAVLTDMAMPRLNGIALIQGLKGINGAVRIIACTGQAEDTYRPQLVEHGVSVVLQKPYISEKLLTALRQILHEEGRIGVKRDEFHPREITPLKTHSRIPATCEAVLTET